MKTPVAVLLEHTLPGGQRHFDLLIDPGGEAALATWRVDVDVAAAAPIVCRAERIGDHRRIYLTYEGPLSGGRGSVRRVGEARGTLARLDAERVEATLDWGRGAARLAGERVEGAWWQLRFGTGSPERGPSDAR